MGAEGTGNQNMMLSGGETRTALWRRLTSMVARLATRKTVVVLGIVELALMVPTAIVGSLAPPNSEGAGVIPVVVAFFGVGLVVAYRRPLHRIGWILLACSFFFVLTALGGSYSVFDYRAHHGHLPLGPIAVMIGPSWAPAIVLLALAVILFPEGHLPSARWRWPVGWLLGLAAVWQLGAFAIAIDAIASGNIRVASGGDLAQIDNPAGAWAWWGVVQDLFFTTLALILLVWIVGQLRGYRRLEGERRIQQKWLLGGAAVCGVAGLTSTVSGLISHSPLAQTISGVATAALCALPLAIGVGILKFRLYDIDRLLSRTLSYAILTALLVGTFVGLVVLTTDALPFSSTVGVAASTLAAFALFNPLRKRIQQAVDRHFNRARYDAERTVAAFAASLRDAVDLEDVQAELLGTVKRAVEPQHVSVWIRPHAGHTQGGAFR
jgi:hypothetical protein